MDKPRTEVQQIDAEPVAVRWLHGRLATLPEALGHPGLTLSAQYSLHYGSLSISCTGGTSEQRAQLVDALMAPLGSEACAGKLRMQPFSYRDTNPAQINFNHLEDAMLWMKSFSESGPEIRVTPRGWALA